MNFLTREQILNSTDLKPQEVTIPEWNGKVLVRGLTGAERDYFEQSVIEQKGKDAKVNLNNIRAKLVSLTVIDENGNRIFQEEDVKKLGEKSASALNRIFEVAQKLSGLTPNEVERLADNLKKDPKGNSISS